MNLRLYDALALIGLLLATGCAPRSSRARTPAASSFTHPQFEDVTAAAGIRWRHNPCRTGKKLLPETVGGGGGFLDYDNDGRMDIILINGAPLPGYRGPKPRLALYHNDGNGQFTDATAGSGIDFDGYGIGLAVGDYDNDGWPDLYITAVGGSRLYHNEHGRFRDVTAASHTGVSRFSTGASWIDYDHDGRLDLFVARYVEWSAATDLPCGPANARQYCPPNQYRGAPPVLLHNVGNGRFEDVSARAGVLGHPSKTLSVSPCDLNGDGWTDLYLANDTEPDVLLINNRNGTFSDVALAAGVALGTDGNPTGSMGVDIGDINNDGRISIAVGTFAGQEASLFTSAPAAQPGSMLFENRKQEVGIAARTRADTTFGTLFEDVDLDGWLDLILANGHIDDDPSLSVDGARVPQKQPVQLFQNMRNGSFRQVTGAGLGGPIIGRGLAEGDFDNDGKPDLLVFENGGPVRLFHNGTQTPGGWLGVSLVGLGKSPRDGAGAWVILETAAGRQRRYGTTARSFLSANDPRLHFGLGGQKPLKLTVRWPDGAVSTVPNPQPNRYVTVRE